MNIPTREDCLDLLNKHNVAENIKKHCKAVSKVAVFLAKKLKENRIDVNVELVLAGSLLHDIGKEDGKPPKGHSDKGYEILKDKYPEIAEIIRVHAFFRVNELKTWEQKIVNYADKRTKHGIMTMKERLEDWQKRLQITLDSELVKKEFELEKQIFDVIGLEPDKLGEYIE